MVICNLLTPLRNHKELLLKEDILDLVFGATVLMGWWVQGEETREGWVLKLILKTLVMHIGVSIARRG